MDLQELINPTAVIASMRVSSKKQVLQQLAAHAAAELKLSERSVFEVLLERERLGSTAVGQGIAIPHGKHPQVTQLYGLFARLETPVDFEAVDDRPVDLVFLLLAPEDAGADHLKALARVSRLLRNQSVVEKLRATRDAAALYAILTEPVSTSSVA